MTNPKTSSANKPKNNNDGRRSNNNNNNEKKPAKEKIKAGSTNTTNTKSNRNKNKNKNNGASLSSKYAAQPPFDLYSSSPSRSSCVSNATDKTSSNSGKDKKANDDNNDIVEYINAGWNGVIELLKDRKNIIVLVGAGISVSCGIPDFRSKDSGLYSTLDYEELGLSCAEELFDIHFFQHDPEPFYKFAKNLYKQNVQPSDSHKLLSLLEQNKMLLRVYTQNIDGLENEAGVSNKKMVYAHGSLQWATCCKCQQKVSSKDIMPMIQQGSVPFCQVSKQGNNNNNNTKNSKASVAKKKSSFNSISTTTTTTATRSTTANSTISKRLRGNKKKEQNNVCGGVLKPTVTFFGETLNDQVRRALEADHDKVDALIVIGTSLSVAPISRVISYLPSTIPRILINRTIVHPSHPPTLENAGSSSSNSDDNKHDNDDDDFRENYVFDAYLLGFCDDVTRALAKQLFSKTTEDKNNQLSKKRKRDSAKLSKFTLKSVLDDYSGTILSALDRRQQQLQPQLQVNQKQNEKGEDENGSCIEIHKIQDWESIKVPRDRVFLFPGAIAENNDNDSCASDLTFQEIAHCDGCSKQINTGVIHKCTNCFDYDLCGKCFPKISKTHFDGSHTFIREKTKRKSTTA